MDRVQQIEELMMDDTAVYAYVRQGDEQSEYVFSGSPENMASFIGSHGMADEIIITDALDRHILNTFGCFIDRCSDPALLEKIKEKLIPIQMGNASPQEVFCPTIDEVEAVYEEKCSDHSQFNMNMEGI